MDLDISERKKEDNNYVNNLLSKSTLCHFLWTVGLLVTFLSALLKRLQGALSYPLMQFPIH